MKFTDDNQKGASMLEVALLASLICVVVLTSVAEMGRQSRTAAFASMCGMCVARGVFGDVDPDACEWVVKNAPDETMNMITEACSNK